MSQESRLTIAGTRDQIQLACEFVVDAARTAGLDERAVYHCQLAVDEVCTNIVEHGYGADGADRSIDLICQLSPQSFTITIIDDSTPFDPLARPDPDPGASLEDRKTGGWGIYFLKQIMDQVSYFHDGRYNHLIMVKHRNSSIS